MEKKKERTEKRLERRETITIKITITNKITNNQEARIKYADLHSGTILSFDGPSFLGQ